MGQVLEVFVRARVFSRIDEPIEHAASEQVYRQAQAVCRR